MKILYFAPIDWNFIRQRPQHIAERLSKFYKFYYIQPFGLRNPKLSDLKRAINRVVGLFDKHPPQGRLKIINLFFIPLINRLIQTINIHILNRQLKSLTDGNTAIWIANPSKIIPGLLKGLNFKTLIYEIMDDYETIHSANRKDI
ncbi:MAG: hypothetical protein KAS04_06335, partial [Candidatus Aenigmarchaeota archaeon]|nr:hypothetical protein [Candidatus Aenigmarchaeota archaeon]